MTMAQLNLMKVKQRKHAHPVEVAQKGVQSGTHALDLKQNTISDSSSTFSDSRKASTCGVSDRPAASLVATLFHAATAMAVQSRLLRFTLQTCAFIQ